LVFISLLTIAANSKVGWLAQAFRGLRFSMVGMKLSIYGAVKQRCAPINAGRYILPMTRRMMAIG
jgi:hypothetical protein